ncbi:type II toxin-antitoxin system RelE/ParE family toxin [Leptolyngbya sp. CCNP1308]|uniref:type II toxin-antitoxin system RelE/ParE family toxin n=1 Tax=Leptolyngbya sp. CCNP1308 TaxID=3110255 RepID=UPI002B21BF0A|nr:type II toxin-antitoxin system RelE/ParE family toxin [Leptolyngbya sp. CCNP1308]MEA5447351.1 type II toxin-antitoxin system RelE/ParE family toxin [Leptolyngbya sp. CCNP1308]
MSYRLIIRPKAERDIQDAFEWYDAQTPGLRSEFIRAVDVCLSGVGRNPFAYSLVYQQARRALVRRFPYAILFVCDQELGDFWKTFSLMVGSAHPTVATVAG